MSLVWGGDSNEIQPDPGPNFGAGPDFGELPGGFLVAVSNRSDHPGTGGIFRIEGPGDHQELHVEETTFRTRPAVSPDGSLIAFASDIRGSYDLFLLPADGGLPFRLTRDEDWDEKDPAWSPDGDEIVFTTNRDGRPALEVIGVHGGAARPLPVTGLRRAGPGLGAPAGPAERSGPGDRPRSGRKEPRAARRLPPHRLLYRDPLFPHR